MNYIVSLETRQSDVLSNWPFLHSCQGASICLRMLRCCKLCDVLIVPGAVRKGIVRFGPHVHPGAVRTGIWTLPRCWSSRLAAALVLLVPPGLPCCRHLRAVGSSALRAVLVALRSLWARRLAVAWRGYLVSDILRVR